MITVAEFQRRCCQSTQLAHDHFIRSTRMSTYKAHCVDTCPLDNFAWASGLQSCPWLHDSHFPSCGSTFSLHSLQKAVFFPLPWLVKCLLLNLVGSPELLCIPEGVVERGLFCIFLLICNTSLGELRSLHVFTSPPQPEAFHPCYPSDIFNRFPSFSIPAGGSSFFGVVNSLAFSSLSSCMTHLSL